MTGSTLDLTSELIEGFPGMSVSLGANGRIEYSQSTTGKLRRIGWAESSYGDAVGELDLSGVDFTALNGEAALAVDEFLVLGNGRIHVNDSAVKNLASGATGDDVFSAVAGSEEGTHIIATTQERPSDYYDGKVEVVVDGVSDETPITGYFDTTGKYVTQQEGAARGTWSWDTRYAADGLYLTYAMTGLELLGTGEGALSLAVDGTDAKLIDVRLSGDGDLVKTGSGTLHLTNEADWGGVADVREGTLAVSVGALGGKTARHATVRVAEGAELALSGALEDDRVQYVKSLDAAGTVTIGTQSSSNALTLALEEGGVLREGADLQGTSNAVLAVANGSTLTATDLEETAADYKGVIYLTDGTTLALSGTEASKYVDLSNVKGTGTIELSDYALYDTTGQFAGTTRVLEGGDLLIAPGSLMNSQAKLEVQGGKVTSQRNPTFASVTLGDNAWLDLGSALAGDDYASGSILSTGNLTLGDVTLKVAAGLDTEGVYASGILSLDNLEGKTTWLLTGKNVTVNGNVRIEGVSDGVSPSAVLKQDGKDIGTVTASLKAVVDRNQGVGFTAWASSMELSDVLVLNGSYTPDADSTLDLQVRNAEGTENGGLRVASLAVTLAGDGSNTYGTLEVDENAVARIAADQTLTRGGEINGRLRSVTGASGTAPALHVTGGTLAIGEGASGDVAIRLDASNEDEGAELLFSNRTTDETAYIYGGDVFGEKGARVTFEKTAGNFRLAGGSAAYTLTGESSVTFGPLANASALSGTYAVGEGSIAYFDFTGAAGEIDLSGVTGAGTGAGTVSLNYGTAAGTLLDVTAMNADFTGTLAFTNATAAIGTDASVAGSALTAFATQKGSLVAGEGSTLIVNNEKVRGADGSFDPKPVKLAGDLTISDRATLDLTQGIRGDHNDEHLGNGSGFSVNTLDMNGHALVIANSDDANHLTVRASLEKVDVSTGLPSNGEYHGSILDMLGNRSTPILTLITGIDATDEALAAIASDMELEDEGENDTHEIKFWQPDWSSDGETSGETTHVANVTTGVKLVASKGEDGLGNISVGAGITGIDIVSGATLRMDESVAAETLSSHIVNASITGAGSVLVSNSLTAPGSKGITFAAENGYTGETIVDLGATLTAAHAGAFAGSERVRVGTMTEDGAGHEPQASTLKVTVAQAETDLYANTLRMKALTVGKNGTVELADGNSLLLTEAGATSTLAEGSTLTGGTTTAIGLAAGTLNIDDMSAIEGFTGKFRVNEGASVNLNVTKDAAWTHDVVAYTDARSRTVGSGRFVKNGAGTLTINGSEGLHDFSGMNLVAAEGTTRLTSATIGGLTAASRVAVDGVLTVQGDLRGNAGNIFELDVVTGNTAERTSGSADSADLAGAPVWALGERGDGIRVTGTVSGTLNLAVTPRSVEQGAAESIQLLGAEGVAEGFDVNLVDKAGKTLEALTAGAYDYTVVRRDNEENGTDVYLSSVLSSNDDIRNTTVTAGSYLGVAAAAQLFDISLHDRMSNRSWLTPNADGSFANSFWILEKVSNERYGDSTGQIDVHNTASTTTVGSDILSGLAAGGTWYAGAMFSYANTDTKSRSNRTALSATGNTDAWAAGLYAGWQLNGADRTGPYVDGWVLWTDAESDVKGVNVSETVDGNGLSASLEAGWGFKALSYNAHGQAGDIFVEPHVSVTWFGYEADGVANDVHDVTFEGKDNIRTKLGVKTYAFGKNSGGFSPFVELNWIHNTETYGATLSGITVDQVGAENQGEVRAGADWRINDAFSVWGHFGITSGSDGYSNREGSLGVRYRF